MHYRSNGKMTIAGLYLWRQITHYFFVFPIESAQHVMLFLWIGSQNDMLFLVGSGYQRCTGARVSEWTPGES